MSPRLPDPRNLGRDLQPPSKTGAPTSRPDVVELASVPGLGRLYARGLAGSVVTAAARRRTVSPTDLPSTRVVVREVRAEAEHLGAYQRLLGEPASDALPAGFVHVLAFPVATALMVRSDFPLPLLGMVHLANQVEQHRPVMLGESLDVTVHAQNLRTHRSGVCVDLVAEVRASGTETLVWSGVSTYLAKGQRLSTAAEPGPDGATGASDPDRDGSGRERAPSFVAPVPTGQWRLDAGLGRRYAAVSGDRNPIHLSALAAKAFGFPRAIAHGMYTAARALADVGPRARGTAFVWEVEFAKPVLLPSTVAVRVARVESQAPAGSYEFVVWDARRSRLHLTGTITPL